MTRFAQRHQIALVVAAAVALAYDVMCDRGGLTTPGTSGVICQEPGADLAPVGVVSPLRCCATPRILPLPLLALMFVTESPVTSPDQIGASSVCAGAGWQMRHLIILTSGGLIVEERVSQNKHLKFVCQSFECRDIFISACHCPQVGPAVQEMLRPSIAQLPYCG